MNLIIFLKRLGRARIITILAAIMSVIVWLDISTGYEVGISVLYLLPVSLAALGLGQGGGALVSLVGAGLWVWADIHSGHVYSGQWIPYWNGFIRWGIFQYAAYLLWTLRNDWEREYRLSRHDSLTGVLNRRAFYEIADEIARDRLARGEAVVLGYLDLDNFKRVNDRKGHETGDELLKTLVEVLQERLPEGALLGRVGGDEFLLAFMGRTREQVKRFCGEICLSVHCEMHRRNMPITISAGVVEVRQLPFDLTILVKKADKLMYKAKRTGKNRLMFGRMGK